jgi:predicted dehydrogenase
MTEPMRFGLIGAGAIAQSYFSAFNNIEEATLVAVADVRPGVAKAAAEQMKCQAFTDTDAMLADGGCEAVIICTPPSTHPEIARTYLSRGIHLLCEKPLAITSEMAQRMIDLADRKGVLLTMGSKFRYVDDVIKAKAIVSSGILGEIILFENAFTAWVDMSERWNSKPEVSGGGVLIDNGTHSVDIMRYFLGPIRDVHVVEGKRLQNPNVEDTVRMFAHSEDGVIGNVDLSWSINKDLNSYIDIYGSQGTIHVGWRESRYRQASSKDWVTFGSGYNKVQAFSSQLRNLVGSIRGKEHLLITSEDALASVRVIESAYKSMRREDWVDVGGRIPRTKVA